MVVIEPFEWSSFLLILRKIPKQTPLCSFCVSGVTVVTHNLALAVISGVIVSASWLRLKSAHHIHRETESLDDGTKVYHLSSTIIFWFGYRF